METESRESASDVFSRRKKDHIEISLKKESQAFADQFIDIEFIHNPIPEIDFSDIDLSDSVFSHPLKSPLFVSSMTLGHDDAGVLNHRIANVCQDRGWMMGVGSQRRQLFDPKAQSECIELRENFPELVLFGNIGLSQVIASDWEVIESLVSSLKAQFLVVHCNPLQEVIQPEGTPQFKGGLASLTELCANLSVPVVLKETGCGFSQPAFEQLKNIGLSAVDVSGRGGTHWGRVEGLRAASKDQQSYITSQTFAHWGITTVQSLENGRSSGIQTPLWGSGGVRSGLDAAKLFALGASKVGFAQPILKAALESEEQLQRTMQQLDHELKVALFCLGLSRMDQLVGRRDLLK